MLRIIAAVFLIGGTLVGFSLAAGAEQAQRVPPMERAAVVISRDHAVDIAKRQGLEHLGGIELSAGAWRIRGATENDRGILISVSTKTGGVRVVEYDAAPC